MSRKIISFLPFFLILGLILVLYLSGIAHNINFQTIQSQHMKWQNFAHLHPVLAALYFIGIYILSVILIIPDAIFLTLLAGLLFPLPLAVLYACFAETAGGTLLFLATWLASKEVIDPQKNRYFLNVASKIQKNQIYYLLFFRFSHLLPFWVINLASGVVHVKPITFIWTTFIGVLPLTYFIALGGESLSRYFATHTHFSIVEFFTPELKIALILLGCLALLPLLVKKLRN